MSRISSKDIVKQAKSNGIKSEDLDELVHEVISKTASSINNGGLEAQIEFLIDKLGAHEVERELKLIVPLVHFTKILEDL